MATRIPLPDTEGQIAKMRGAADLTRHLGQGALATIAGGLVGLGNLPRGAEGMERARQTITDAMSPGDLSPEGIGTVQNTVAPVYHAIMDTGPTVRVGGRDLTTPTLGQNMESLGNTYNQGVRTDADLVGKYLGPQAGAGVEALGAAAPNMIFPEAGAERAAVARMPAGVGEMMNLSPERLFEDGANAGTLAREAAARRRMAEDGIEPQPYSEPFAGRQAEHEGAVAARRRPPAHTIQMEPANEAQAPWAPPAEYPEGTMAFTARDPETGDLLGRQVVAQRGNTMQSVRMDTRPDMQQQGIGTSLFQRALNHAHENGMDFASDTQVSVPAMKTYLKHPGESYLNPAHEEVDDPVDGPVIRSSNGQPIVSFPRPPETEPGKYVSSQAHAKGGRIGMLAGLGDLIKQTEALKGMPIKATIPGSSMVRISPIGVTHEKTIGTHANWHTVKSPNGRTEAIERPSGDLQIQDSETNDAERGRGEGTARLEALVQQAHKNGNKLFSDNTVSPAEQSIYKKLQNKGYNVVTNDHTDDLSTGVKTGVNGSPVYAVHPDISASRIIEVGPHQPARDAAAAYMKEAGLPYNPPSTYAQVDPARAKQIADAFEAMPHAPNDPAVKASYDAMINETLAQYQHMKNAGVNVEFMPPGKDPYAASPRLAAEDVRKNNHMFVYPTDAGFGNTGEDVSGNPLLAQSGENFGGIPATHNDVFRAVHDYFGHAKEGVGFRANGEENAWRQHAGMYSDIARPAMTTETRGQNSWLNYGPHGDTNRTAKTADTVFAPQKTGILPDEFNNLEDPELHFLHMSNLSTPTATLDPSFYGTGIKGAEARRGGTKTTSLYPADIAPSDIEHGLESKTPYRVSMPRASMYDISADPEGLRAGAPNFSEAEDAIKDSGYAGYHVPEGDGIFRGQARLFHPTPATCLGPDPGGLRPGEMEDFLEQMKNPTTSTGGTAVPQTNVSDIFSRGRSAPKKPMWQPFDDTTDTSGFAEGGEVGTALGGLGALVRKYAPSGGNKIHTVVDPLAQLSRKYTPAQQPAVRDAFKQWFGDSHAVVPAESSLQSSTTPLTLYHGTRSDIKAFKPEAGGVNSTIFGSEPVTRHAMFFSEHPDVASDFAGQGGARSGSNVMPVHLSVQNPLYLEEGFEPDAVEKLAAQGVDRNWMENHFNPTRDAQFLFDEDNHGKFFRDSAIKAGYDGVVFPEPNAELGPNGNAYINGTSRAWAAFHPEQVKSAIGNSGAFDASTPEIHMAEGGAVGEALAGLGALVRRYAPEAEHLAGQVSTHGGVTYNPTSGELHTTGYAVPTHPARSVALDAPPSPDDLHDFMMTHQDAFDEDPQASLHVHGDENGNSYLHVAHVTPDFEHASDVARQHGVPGFQDLGTGDIHGASMTAPRDVPETTQPDADLVEKYLQGSPRAQAPWKPGQQTVANPQRNAFPGVYGDPRTVIADATQKVGPEDPLLQQLFGVSRSDLSDLALSRQGNELGNLPGARQNPQGSAAARDVMTPKNEQRLIDMMGEARKSPDQRLFKGMTGWYAMDPLYERFRQIYGDEEAPSRYHHFNTMVGMASPGSTVDAEIARGTGAHWLNNEGRFNDFMKFGDEMESSGRPTDMGNMPGHMYHKTSQALPMQRYLDNGTIQMKSPKVPLYIQASGVPETGFQTETPVGDAHWARGVGLADTRGTRTLKGKEIVPGSSVSTPEMQTLAPWWRNRVAGPAGLESVPAQALAWGAYSPYTGVKSNIGAPKLEILSTQIGKLAQRLGISPESARDMVISGKAGAFSEGGVVDDVLAAGGI